MYGVFVVSAVVNITKDVDIILNNVVATFSETPISNKLWIYCMFIPTLITCCLLGILFFYIFRKELIGIYLKNVKKENKKTSFSIQQKFAIGIIVLLWATNSVHAGKIYNKTWFSSYIICISTVIGAYILYWNIIRLL